MDTSSNPHTEQFPHCQVVYWKDGVAAGKRDRWTHAEVQHTGGFPHLNFDWARRFDLETMLELMGIAYEAGKRAKGLEVLRNLGYAGEVR